MSEQSVATEPTSTAESAPRRRRRRSSRRAGARSSRIRLVYFLLASAWGFVTGTTAVAGLLAAVGRPLTLEPRSAVALAGAGVVALVGGVVASRAYRETRSRVG